MFDINQLLCLLWLNLYFLYVLIRLIIFVRYHFHLQFSHKFLIILTKDYYSFIQIFLNLYLIF
jgi:hypothetical protein